MQRVEITFRLLRFSLVVALWGTRRFSGRVSGLMVSRFLRSRLARAGFAVGATFEGVRALDALLARLRPVAPGASLQNDGLGLEERIEPFGAALAPDPGLLEAAERDPEVGSEGVVSDGA